MKPLRFLLENLIDYAGLFPPAELTMAEAVRNYAAYRQSEHSWMLGKFIVPASRLDEFEQAATICWPRDGEDVFWKLSALGGANLQDDLTNINRFSHRQTVAKTAALDTIEFKASTVAEIQTAMRAIRTEKLTLTCFIEIPINDDPRELIKSVSAEGAFAKVRTGGVTADAFPSSQNLARFIAVCAEEDVAFKATAGLHHPLRSVNRLTYKADSDSAPSAMMHGFLNVFLAAAFAQNGASVEQLTAMLEETSPEAFRFEEGCVYWRDEMLVVGHIRNARHLFAISFGSCSFTEPIEDLQRLELL
ncbi:MAG: hypothetical protein AAB401_19540 [Acidobacteriota bacterium]